MQAKPTDPSLLTQPLPANVPGNQCLWPKTRRIRGISVSLTLIYLGFLCLGFSLPVCGQTPDIAPPDITKREAANERESFQVKHLLQNEQTAPSEGAVLVGGYIKPRDFYPAYLAQVSEITQDLLHVREILQSHQQSLTLQQLGALTQRLSVSRNSLQKKLIHGEEAFNTYQLIDKAVSNLEEAIEYWRVANRTRPWIRGGIPERQEDDEILKLKLQTAVNTIDELKELVKTRKNLSDGLDEDR
jgi:hypothetical protein